MDSALPIPKFTGTNYFTWSSRAKTIFNARDLLKYIEAPMEQHHPQQDETNIKIAQALLVSMLDDKVYSSFMQHNNPRTLWNELERVYARVGEEEITRIQGQLSQTKLQNYNVEKYLNDIEELVMKLGGAGLPMTEKAKFQAVLNGLPEDMNMFVMGIEALPDELKTFEFAKTKIKNAVKNRKNTPAESVLANTSIKCNYCHKLGHLAHQCWTKNPQLKRQKFKKIVMCNTSNSCSSWLLDGGSSIHVTNDYNDFVPGTISSCNSTTKIANGTTINSTQKGDVEIRTKTEKGTNIEITFKNVIYAPEFEQKIISEAILLNLGYEIKKVQNQCKIVFENDAILLKSKYNLFYINGTSKLQSETQTVNSIWHTRLCHVNNQTVERTITHYQLKHQNSSPKDHKCEICIRNKQAKDITSKIPMERTQNILDLVHTDICGPFPETNSGFKYYISFIDDCSRYTRVYLMHNKGEAVIKYKEYSDFVKTQTGKNIKQLKSDNGTEYLANAFQEQLKQAGTEHITTSPYSPHQNGVAERKNRTITETVRCMLDEAKLSQAYWGEATCTAIFTINRIPATNEETSPYEKFFGKKAKIHHIKQFGCKCYMQVPKELRKKLEATSIECKLLGYKEHTDNYRLLTADGRIVYNRNVKFIEQEDNIQTPNKAEDDITEHKQETFIKLPPHQSKETKEGPQSNKELNLEQIANKPTRTSRINYKESKTYNKVNAIIDTANDEPSIKDALSSANKEEWEKAIQSEIQNLVERGTWSEVPKTNNENIIDSKIVLKRKRDENGNISKYKARLVARGFEQVEGLNYSGTFAPVVNWVTILICIIYAVNQNLLISQIDFESAYLNANIDTEIFMQPPKEIASMFKESTLLKLHKSIYGLKQAGKLWNETLNDALKKFGWEKSECDACLLKRTKPNLQILLVYVDDILIISKSTKEAEDIKKELKSIFKIKDLGKLKFFLGIEFNFDKINKSFKINQKTSIERMLFSESTLKQRIESVPFLTGNNHKKYLQIAEPKETQKYQAIVGKLLYIARMTRPDICFAVSIAARYASNPGPAHFQIVEKIIRYLNSTKDNELSFDCQETSAINSYCDADWAGDINDRKSTTGIAIFIGKGLIYWKSRKQTSIAQSTMESEIIALNDSINEVKFIKKILQFIGVEISSTNFYCDNKPTIMTIKNPYESTKKSKHIDIKFNHIKENLQTDSNILEHIASERNIADIFTKGLSKDIFNRHSNSLGLLKLTLRGCVEGKVS